MAASPVQALQDESTCTICLDYFAEPMMIVGCGHNFCNACITEYWQQQGSPAGVSCPQCRVLFPQPVLAPNRQLGNVVEMTRKLSLQSARKADPAEELCRLHQEPLKLFCQKDRTPVCVVCDRAKEHRDHPVVPIEEAAQEQEEQIQGQIKAPLRTQRYPFDKEDGTSSEAYRRVITTTDLLNWKVFTKPLSTDPRPMCDLVAGIMQTYAPNWQDIQILLTMLLSGEERERVKQCMRQILEEEAKAANLDPAAYVQEHMPPHDPNWNPYNADHRANLDKLRTTVVLGMKKAGQKAQDPSRIAEVIQGKDESPGAFMQRIKEAYRAYTSLDPEDPANRQAVNMTFITQAAKDIRKKLQKQKGVMGMDHAMLLDIARKVYENRDTEEEKARKHALEMAAAVVVALRGKYGEGRGRGRGTRGRGKGRSRREPLPRNQCPSCFQEGHWKRECPNKGQPQWKNDTGCMPPTQMNSEEDRTRSTPAGHPQSPWLNLN